jgi:hypothetical protein
MNMCSLFFSLVLFLPAITDGMASTVIMLVSCKTHEDRWGAYESMLTDTQFPYVILVGNRSKQHQFVAKPAAVLSGSLLTIDVSDHYEGLFLKVLSGISFISDRWPGFAILKLDDDMYVHNTTSFVQLLEEMQANEDYAGNSVINHTFQKPVSLKWHMGRSHDPVINRTDHQRRCNYRCSYIKGPSYFLSVRSVAHVKRYIEESIASDVESHWYEDQAVGEILRFHGILPSPSCHLVERGALIKHVF